ncbi:ANR family transcriptional regulator [Rouxiella badensis]|uniref:ANR family transcriptional regulator n=1 Tax=Rouxiella badensis TaxID=1646377 RepID=UPI001D146454|nr:ANR family transcriptional regulator [Rouxiella badensis]MCC3733680.1 ANR family transcriptional regulator [Rouxiella badensis]MCC3759666.1 ANR family transcriptional regulator [Rouxiella badensis]
MTLGYINLSQQAVAAEQRGDFSEAANLWAQANSMAHGKNVYWSEDRASFCNKAVKRAKVEAGEIFPHEQAN